MGSPAGVLRGLHVLVVEDDRDAREILTTVLEYMGALVTAAPTAAEALRHLRAMTPDVVLADMHLGRHDAGALLARARKAGTTAPFIVVSAADYDPHGLERMGFAAYLRKPVDHARLVDTILAVIARR